MILKKPKNCFAVKIKVAGKRLGSISAALLIPVFIPPREETAAGNQA